MNCVVVDPGVSGGVVMVRGGSISTVLPMPEDMAELGEALDGMPAESRMFVELVGGYVGGDGQPGSRMFTFGKNDGWFDGYAAARHWPLKRIAPTSWQVPLQLGHANEQKDKAAWKRLLKQEAARRFPEWKPTLKTADALLIWAHVRTKFLEPQETRPVGQVEYKLARLKRLARTL